MFIGLLGCLFQPVLFSCTNTDENQEGEKLSYGSISSCPDNKHPHAIDLGINAYYACCNLGASSPEEYGAYFAWGESEEKKVYTTDTHIETPMLIVGTPYDTAHTLWGGNWQMPLEYQINDVMNKCKFKWVTFNGVNGIRVTGPNGKNIFLPAAGYNTGIRVDYKGKYCCYWTGNPIGDIYKYQKPKQAKTVFSSEYTPQDERAWISFTATYCYLGVPIRPVIRKE